MCYKNNLNRGVEYLKKIWLILSLATMVCFTPFLFHLQAKAETESSKEKYIPIDLPPAKKMDTEKYKIASRYTFEPHQFTEEEMEKIRNAPEGTSVGSDGSIIYPEEQLKAIQEKGTKMTGSYGKLGKPSTEKVTTLGAYTPVTDRNEYPYGAIAEIQIFTGYGYTKCTGYFVDANTVVTAAHCLYDTDENYYYEEAVVVPFYQEDPENYIGYVSSDFKISTSWINVEPADEDGNLHVADCARDYAVINLHPDAKPAEEFGWFALRNYDHEVGEGVNVSGFPASQQSSPIDLGFDLYKSLGHMTQLDTYLFIHDALSEGGNSGSPVFNQKEGTLAAIGVHNGSNPNDPEFNTAARMIGYNFNNITYWSGLNE